MIAWASLMVVLIPTTQSICLAMASAWGCEAQAFGRGRDFLLVAIRGTDGAWNFNPLPGDRVEGGCALIAIVTPGGRQKIEALFAADVVPAA